MSTSLEMTEHMVRLDLPDEHIVLGYALGHLRDLMNEIDRLRAEKAEANNQWRLDYNTCAAARDHLRAELAKRQWQDISTAPKDGTEILIACRVKELSGHSCTQYVVFYDENPEYPMNVWQTPDGIAYHRDLPTHWMPLPPAP